MVLVMKVSDMPVLQLYTLIRHVLQLTAFCWNVYDGTLRDEDLVEFQRNHAIRELPSMLNFAAYVVRKSANTSSTAC